MKKEERDTQRRSGRIDSDAAVQVRGAAERSRRGRVKGASEGKTSVENLLQCGAAEQLPACTSGIPSSELKAANRDASTITEHQELACAVPMPKPF